MREHAVVSHAAMPCPGYWHTIKCYHRMKSITTLNIWDTWNRIPALSPSLPNLCCVSLRMLRTLLLRQSQTMTSAIIWSLWIRTRNGKTKQKRRMKPWVDVHVILLSRLSQPVAVSRPSTTTIIIIFYLSSNNKNKIIAICIKMGHASDSIKLMCYGTSTKRHSRRCSVKGFELNWQKEILIHFFYISCIVSSPFISLLLRSDSGFSSSISKITFCVVANWRCNRAHYAHYRREWNGPSVQWASCMWHDDAAVFNGWMVRAQQITHKMVFSPEAKQSFALCVILAAGSTSKTTQNAQMRRQQRLGCMFIRRCYMPGKHVC